MQKTKKIVRIPLLELFDGKAAKLIEDYGSVENLVKHAHENGSFNKKLKFLLDEMNISSPLGKITFHTARHTFATLLLEKGINPVSIQNMLGHSSLNMTMSVYATVTKNSIMNDIKRADS